MKTLIATMALVAALSTSALAADAVMPAHYAGVDVGQQKMDGNSVDSMGVHAGVMLNKNFAVELGLAQTQDETNGAVKGNLLTGSADLVGILPVVAVPKLDLLGTVGVEEQILTATKAAAHVDHDDAAPNTDANAKAFGATIGAGAQYHLTDALSVRGLVKYEDVSLTAINQKHDVKSTVGLNVAF